MKNNYMDIREFVDTGLLQEVNRQFLHPLGLALEVSVDSSGEALISGIVDSRETPGGIAFGEPVDGEGARYVKKLKAKNFKIRNRLFRRGGTVQPVGIGVGGKAKS